MMKTRRSKMGLMFLLSIFGLLLGAESMASPAGTVLADTSAGGDTARVYQSFFGGNPVYYQTWRNFFGADDRGGFIKRHGLEGDTVVDGVNYHKLSVNADHHEIQFWIRESERHDKVWVRMPWDSSGQEVLVVDMDLKERDSFPMYGYGEWVRTRDSNIYYPGETYYVVDSVYYQEHPGGLLKHIRLCPQNYNGYTQMLETTVIQRGECDWLSRHLEFIEGVGSNLGFVYSRNGMVWENLDPLWGPLYSCADNGSGVLLDYIVCMDKDSMTYYVHPNPECADCGAEQLYQGYEEDLPPIHPANESLRSMSRYLRLSPNPARDEVSLRWTAESPVDGACRITLYDMQGVRLRSYTADRWPYTLRVSGLPSGTYVLRVEPEDASATWQATVRLMRL